MPKNDKRNHQLLSSLTIDKEQQISEQHDDTSNTHDEHKQIASYTNQLAYLTDKQHFQDRSRRTGYNHQQRAQKKLIVSKLEAKNR